MTVFCLGEAMGEISLPEGLPPQVAVGGDVFNTAVYLAHLGVSTAFVGAVGNDPFGQRVRHMLDHHGIDAGYMTQEPGSTGLYAITTDAAGERSFHYWREQAPARRMLEQRDIPALAAAIGTGVLYLSGITLWVLRNHLPQLAALLAQVQGQGGRIVFDGNFRPRLWGADRDLPRRAAAAVLARSALALLTHDDEQMLWGDATPQATLDRTLALHCPCVVVKRGGEPCIFADAAGAGEVAVPAVLTPVDTTAAGDSFNAGFLAVWLEDPAALPQAVQAGHRLAAEVVCHHGAILADAALIGLRNRILPVACRHGADI